MSDDYNSDLYGWLSQFPVDEQEIMLRFIQYLCSDQSYYDDIHDPDFSIFVHLDLIAHGYTPHEMTDSEKVAAMKRIQRVSAAKLN